MKFNFGAAVVERTENADGAVILRIRDDTADIQYAIVFGEVWLYCPSKDIKYINSSMEKLFKEVDEEIGGERNSAKFFKKLAERELAMEAGTPANMAHIMEETLECAKRQNSILYSMLHKIR